jgi:hypothetical protein
MSVTIPSHLSNDELMATAPRLAGDERAVTADLIAHLAEIDRRALYVPAGFASLYSYCREGLGLSEDAAYNRKTAAQVARRFPVVLDMLADGRLSLTALRLLAPVLTGANHDEAFSAATGKSRREVEEIVARLDPKPDVRSTVRKLPAPAIAVPERDVRETGHPALFGASPGSEEAVSAPRTTVPAHRPIVAPLAPERYRVQFTIRKEAERKLRRLQELLKREIPGGDPAVIFDRALTVLLEKVESRKNGVTARPRISKPVVPGTKANSRHMPAAVRRDVVRRDAGQCAFVAVNGRRCTERAFIEYHHARTPYAHGGAATPENIALHCRAHNAYAGRRLFGPNLPREIKEARAAEEAVWTAAPGTDAGRADVATPTG